MSIVRDGFKSLYRSGAGFTAVTLPKYLLKAGVPKAASAMIARLAGNVAGIASVMVGIGFLAALPPSIPMFFVAATVMHVKGMLLSAAVAGLLAGTGTVVLTAGLGMCRDTGRAAGKLFKSARTGVTKQPCQAPMPPEKNSFRARAKPLADFKAAVAGEAIKPEPAAALPVPGRPPAP